MYPINPYFMRPSVHRLKYDDLNRVYYLVEDMPYFNMPGKLYGDIIKHANHFWRAYNNSEDSMGVMFTGNTGSGKSQIAKVLSNIGIQNGMPVVTVADIPVNIDMIQFISNLNNVVILFDEFAKTFDNKMQEKMLTMLSGIDIGKKLFIITENESNHISKFIRNRPGRVRYSVDYSRVSKSVIDEYCLDYGVDSNFYKDLIAKYKESTEFSFDHLKAIVREHIENPEISFQDTIEILNMEILSRPATLTVESVYDIIDNKDMKITNADTVAKKDFLKGSRIYVNLESGKGINISKKFILSIDDNRITCLVSKKWKVVLISETGKLPTSNDVFF